MLDKLTHADFSPHLQTIFTIHFGEDAFLEALLIQVDAIGKSNTAPAKRQAFSLIFHVRENNEDYLPQRMYEIQHPEMGKFELFLVPLGSDETGFRYEAVFT